MAHVILLVSSAPERVQAWEAQVRQPASTLLVADTRAEACAWVRQVRPDLIVADAALRDGPVEALLRQVRAQRRLAQVPVVIRTDGARTVACDAATRAWDGARPVRSRVAAASSRLVGALSVRLDRGHRRRARRRVR